MYGPAQKSLRANRVAAGLCFQCGKDAIAPNSKSRCAACLAKQLASNRKCCKPYRPKQAPEHPGTRIEHDREAWEAFRRENFIEPDPIYVPRGMAFCARPLLDPLPAEIAAYCRIEKARGGRFKA